MGDWMNLHDLEAIDCKRIIECSSIPVNFDSAQFKGVFTTRHGLSADDSWVLAAEGLGVGIPLLGPLIQHTRENTKTVFNLSPQKRSRAYTLNDGGNGYPLVSCDYQNLIADTMTIAHEFGHAVQQVACEGRFIVPVMRETCAFVSELALHSFLRRENHELHEGAEKILLRDNNKFLGKYFDDFLVALDSPHLPYRYQWNYPIARVFSVQCWEKFSPRQLSELFKGNMSPNQMIDLLR